MSVRTYDKKTRTFTWTEWGVAWNFPHPSSKTWDMQEYDSREDAAAHLNPESGAFLVYREVAATLWKREP